MHSFNYEHQNDQYDKVPGAVRHVNIHHNGDYSGDVVINVMVQLPGQSEQDALEAWDGVELEIPFEALKRFVAGYVFQEKIGKLEAMSDDELLAEGAAELS